jgi:hypothetical protein
LQQLLTEFPNLTGPHMSDHNSTAGRSPAIQREPHSHRRVLRRLLQALGLGLTGVAVLLGALALRSIPLAGQLWNRPELARANQAPVMTAAEKTPADLAFRCC